TGKIVGSGNRLTINGGNFAYSGATSGNSGTIVLGSGNFFLVKDRRATTTAVTLSSLLPGDLPIALTWTTGATTGEVTSYSAAGLTVTHDATGSHSGIGVAYGGPVTVDGVSSSPASTLNYVEGVGITLTGINRFDGALTLNSQGQSLTNSSSNLNSVGSLTLLTEGGNYYQTVEANFGGTGGGVIAINLGSGTYNDHANGQAANRFSLTATKSLSIIGGGTDIASSGTVIELGVNWYGLGNGVVTSTNALTVNNTGVMDGATNLLPATVSGRLVPVARVKAITGTRVVTTAELTISGVTSGGNALVYGLVALSGSSITIDTSSSFGNDLSLIATNGAIIQSTGASLSLASGKTLTLSSTNGKISLGEVTNSFSRVGGLSSTGSDNGIVVASASAMSLTDSISSAGIVTLTSGGAISLTKTGGLTISSNGAIGMTATGMVLGSAVTVSGGALTLGLRGGALTGGQSLTASGLAVVFSGATSGNAATIAVGSGSFAYVYDNRSTTTATTINNSSSFAANFGGASGNRTIAGLTVTGSNDAAIQELAAVYGGAVTIDGIGSGAAKLLTTIEGTSITVSGAASAFTGVLRLRASGTVTMGANLTTVGAATIIAGGMSLTSNVTATGSSLTIDLGATGVYNNGASGSAGFTLDTSGKNLSITAASISNTTPTNATFRIGSTGVLTLGVGGLALATKTRSTGSPTYSSSYITSANEATFN
ncbi:MAG: hypothetical protein ORO03_00445, partial [Alphaproteobacteria bacterium]|nr:hypothetical protein [Alphaproteobacteria bacterium]